MFRILIVEDRDNTREQLFRLFSEEFPKAKIEKAGTVREALKKIHSLNSRGLYYHAVILDFKLPESMGENPEIDVSICNEIRDKMPESFV